MSSRPFVLNREVRSSGMEYIHWGVPRIVAQRTGGFSGITHQSFDPDWSRIRWLVETVVENEWDQYGLREIVWQMVVDNAPSDESVHKPDAVDIVQFKNEFYDRELGELGRDITQEDAVNEIMRLLHIDISGDRIDFPDSGPIDSRNVAVRLEARTWDEDSEEGNEVPLDCWTLRTGVFL